MVIIDGSYGEGGGQILRTSLALSLVTGKPFSIHNIRAGRKKPGLMRQHLTAVNAAAEIGQAAIEGNIIGSQAFTFEPVINRMGPNVNAVLEKPGFYPAGGGRFKVFINPAGLNWFDLLERGKSCQTDCKVCPGLPGL